MTTKTAIDGERIFTLPDFLTSEECAEFIRRSESIGYDEAPITTRAGFVMRKDIRNNTRVIMDDYDLAGQLWNRLMQHMPSPFAGMLAKELNERFRFYRYTPGQRFARHLDGHYRRDNGDISLFTFLIYLNDDFHGGGTVFSSRSKPLSARKPEPRSSSTIARCTKGQKYVTAPNMSCALT